MIDNQWTTRLNGLNRMVSLFLLCLCALCLCAIPLLPAEVDAAERWSIERANQWQEQAGWLVGCNYNPSSAINQLEMWQAESFDLETIDRELGWAEELGFNSIRVFLHDLLWKQDADGLCERIDQFLDVADRHGIGVMFVLLDSVWDPHPVLGTQRDPIPHLHNSGWLQSPGADLLKDPARHDELEPYIKGIISRYKNDSRIQVWDLFNEPENPNTNSYGDVEIEGKPELALALSQKVFAWAREIDPNQPLTAAVWRDEWNDPKKLTPINRFMLENSDVTSFHQYSDREATASRVSTLQGLRRPILCTEYMARPVGSTFETILPLFKEQKVGAYCWGFVAGKTQTIYPWDSWQRKYTAEPPLWFHDIFRADGTPYKADEVKLIRNLMGVGQ